MKVSWNIILFTGLLSSPCLGFADNSSNVPRLQVIDSGTAVIRYQDNVSLWFDPMQIATNSVALSIVPIQENEFVFACRMSSVIQLGNEKYVLKSSTPFHSDLFLKMIPEWRGSVENNIRMALVSETEDGIEFSSLLGERVKRIPDAPNFEAIHVEIIDHAFTKDYENTDYWRVELVPVKIKKQP